VREGVESWRAKAELGGGVDNLLRIFKSLDGGNREFLMKESKTEAGLGLLFCRAGDRGRRGCVSVPCQPLHPRDFIYLFDLTIYLERRKGARSI